MAANTPKSLRNMIVYEVYVRNHGKTGTFKDVIDDLNRIRELGADILWLMPIHPIGKVNKKGALGCPYAIRDYNGINPEYGTEKDFRKLIDKTHQNGMKIMMDVVYNHTSHDAVYTREHPEFYYKKPDGSFGNRVADWGDIIDLDYSCAALWDAQIASLKKWALMGVDGFRCDVAPFIPMEFWARARKEIAEINPDFLWLAETVHPHFLEEMRAKGLYCASDSQTLEVFDMVYDYDTHYEFLSYIQGGASLEEVLEKKRAQESIFPDNYVKVRFLENHDNPRAKSLIRNVEQLYMWTAFLFFEKGATLLYAGQEAMDSKLPSLFDTDKTDWSGLNENFTAYIAKLSGIKKQPIFAEGTYQIHKSDKKGVIYASYTRKNRVVAGIFNIENKMGELDLSVRDRWGNMKNEVPDGIYANLVDGSHIEVKNGRLKLINGAMIFSFSRRL